MGQELSVQAQEQFAKLAQHSDIVPNEYRNKPANIFIAVNYGQSLGLSPAEALYRINVIRGKPVMSSELIASKVREAGHKLHILKDEKNMSVTAEIIRADDPEYPFRVTRDMEWAKQMGLTGKDNWVKQPLTMLTWRAVTACAREACPETLFGAGYTADEIRESMDTVSSQATVSASPVVKPVAQAKPTPTPVVQATAEQPVTLSNKEQQTQWNKIMHSHNVTTVEEGTRILQKVTGLQNVKRMADVPYNVAAQVLDMSDLDKTIETIMHGDSPSTVVEPDIVEAQIVEDTDTFGALAQ